MDTEKQVNMDGDELQPATSKQEHVSGEDVKPAQTREADAAAKFLATVGPFPPMSPEQEKKLVRKIDFWMVPLVCSTGEALRLAVV